MPWQEICAMRERTRFVVEACAATESMSELCRQFGVSRKTGYKWLARYVGEGPAGLVDRRRIARHRPHSVEEAVREAVLDLRGEHPSWGPRKLAAKLARMHPELQVPAPSTIGELLHVAGLTVSRRRRRHVPPRTEPLAHATGPNAVWCADFKGDFALGDGSRCFPPTISDAHSRYLLRCQALARTSGDRVQPLFEATFREFGLPDVIRTDNGPPFATTGAGGLSALSVWWVKLGIRPERIDPGRPAQNGRHQRMHRTLKAEACQPPADSPRGQQLRFDRFHAVYNDERPHEALGQVPPAELYQPSARRFPARLAELSYPDADVVLCVRHDGCIRWRRREVYLTKAIAGELVGLTAVDALGWEVHFGPLVLGTFQLGMNRLRPPQR
jgi:transposase InsO family protein